MLITKHKSFFILHTLITPFLRPSHRFCFSMHPQPKFQFYDIAANLTDDQFGGQYHGKDNHQDDRPHVIHRAKNVGCTHLLIAAGNIEDAIHSYEMCQTYENCFATIGVHPCRAR